MTTKATTQDIKFTDEQVQNLTGFFDVLRRIHTRLAIDGYMIKDRKIEKPAEKHANDPKGQAR